LIVFAHKIELFRLITFCSAKIQH